MKNPAPRPYIANPFYSPAGGTVTSGWEAPVSSIGPAVSVVAIDGPAICGWQQLVDGLRPALARTGRDVTFVPTTEWMLPWPRVQALTSSLELHDDPDFDRLASCELGDLMRPPPRLQVPPGGLLVVYGPGAALGRHDVLWYADLPKRYAEAAIGAGRGLNLGQPVGTGPGTTKRLFFIDWPLLDRHRDRVAAGINWWVDMQDPVAPAVFGGTGLRATLAELATGPFRTRPTFNTTPWGGHWGQDILGHNPDAVNSALGYELIAPEAGVLVGRDGGPRVELPFQLVVSAHPLQLLGSAVHSVFGTSFPVRFDYLDTVGGGNLSVHCHPQADYMRQVFGWPYTQHESYYVMVGGKKGQVFLGLRADADVDKFRREAYEADEGGKPLEITSYVPTFPATAHQLFLIPGGTPHGSGVNNVVLEVSATPYLYSLRFYDWLRRDLEGGLRPVHVGHAFRNLDAGRRGDAVERDLIQRPRSVRGGEGWSEELLGSLPDMFFEVRRTVLQPGAVAGDDASAGFHVLNVVDGDGVLIETANGRAHTLAYAETLVVPAATGTYTLQPLGPGPVRVVKALVR